MFGYIKPMISELKVREYELYKSMYCGLCRAMGKHICQSQRFTLSYDIVFLALVRTALTNEKIHIEKRRCAVHPIKKKNSASVPNTLRYCSQAAAILTYYNLKDDIEDKSSAPKIKYKLMLPHAKRFIKKANDKELEQKIKMHLNELADCEKANSSLDKSADCFAKLLGKVFCHNIYDIDIARYAYETGYHIGRWIYIIDASDDISEDRKNGAYNPLKRYDDIPYDMLKISATLELSQAKASIDSADIKNNALKAIIDNIITLGMPEIQDKILKEKSKE